MRGPNGESLECLPRGILLRARWFPLLLRWRRLPAHPGGEPGLQSTEETHRGMLSAEPEWDPLFRPVVAPVVPALSDWGTPVLDSTRSSLQCQIRAIFALIDIMSVNILESRLTLVSKE